MVWARRRRAPRERQARPAGPGPSSGRESVAWWASHEEGEFAASEVSGHAHALPIGSGETKRQSVSVLTFNRQLDARAGRASSCSRFRTRPVSEALIWQVHGKKA